MQESYPSASRPSTDKTTGKTGKSPPTGPNPWATHASALATWVDKHLVNRRDCYGGYYRKGDAIHTTTRKATDKDGPLTLATIVKHFEARGTDAVIGLHSTYRDEAGECWSRWLGIDVDRHGEGGDPNANKRFVLTLFALLVSLGFRPILTDSDGKGGYHLRIVFAAPVPTRLVFAFARWLIREWESHGLEKEPETFPKQPGIPEGGYGNWMRVFGRHPKRDHWPRVYDGTQWLGGSVAIMSIISTEGADESLIPAEARPDPNAPFDLGRAIEAKRAQGAAELGNKPRREPAEDGTTEPGDDFNDRASWAEILVPHGWVLDHESDERVGFWRRPGKSAGHSATTNHSGDNTLYVFTDGSVFKQSGSYTKFGAYCFLEHGGDWTAATRTLSQRKYGTFATWVEGDNGESVREIRQNPCPKGTRIAKPGERPPVKGTRFGGGQPPIDPSTNGQHAEQPRQPSLNERLANRPRTDLGNAERLVARHGADLRYCHPWKKWLVWDGTRWKLDDTGAIRRRARQTVRAIFKEAATIEDEEKRKAHALWQFSSETRDKLGALVSLAEAEEGTPILPADLDRDPWLLNCANGTLDLRTGHLREHRREDRITQLCPVRYDSHAECPLWTATLHKVFAGNLDLIGFWQRLCGYILTGTVTEQILPILHGGGSNGKSTLLNTLLSMLGTDYAMKAMSDLLMVKRTETHPTDKADLFGKRLVVAIETEEGAKLNEVFIKELTGSDPIRARRMREDPWQFDPTHKVMLCTNHKPAVRGTDYAIWRRLKLIPFDVKIPDDQAVLDMPAKLLGELPGILAWCAQGCLDWQEDGLKPPKEVTDATKEYKIEEDVLGAFLAEHCTILEGLRAKSTPLYTRYHTWAERSGETPVNQRKFGKAMTERGFERLMNDGTWYQGIGLRSDD